MSTHQFVRALRTRWIPAMRDRGWHAELVDPDGADPILLIDHDERFVRVPLNAISGTAVAATVVEATLEMWVDYVPVSDPEAAEYALPVLTWGEAGEPRWQLTVRRGRHWVGWNPGPLTTAAVEHRLGHRALGRAALQEVRLDGQEHFARLRCSPGPAAAAFAWPTRSARPARQGQAALVCGPDLVYVGAAAVLRRLRDTELPYGMLLGAAQLQVLSRRLRSLAHGGR
ncbi:hypothetical protein GCM10010452_84700 [Crossiella cryophila]